MAVDISFESFLQKASALAHFSLDQYHSHQLERRIRYHLERQNIHSLAEFLRLLEQDEEHLKAFQNMLTINVSEFFRNPERFQDLERVFLLPAARNDKFQRLRLWSAGCSMGTEIYSMALLLQRHGLLQDAYLLGSDIDPEILNQAREATYRLKYLKNIPPELFQAHFLPADTPEAPPKTRDDGLYRLSPQIRRCVQFKQHDLLQSPFPANLYDLILCRNVMIYFNEAAKISLFQNFHHALKPQGLLAIGSTEQIPKAVQGLFQVEAPFLFRKLA